MSTLLRSHRALLTTSAAIVSALLLALLSQEVGLVTAPALPTLQFRQTVGSPPVAETKQETPRSMPSSRSARPLDRDRPPNFEENFILKAAEPARASQNETGVPASVTIAQAILESDWGRSGLSLKANNYFGIKARPDPGPAGVVYMDTWENLGGRNVTMNEPFRAYNSMEESFIDHGLFLKNRPWYGPAFKFVDDARQFAREIHKAGYATDPNYASKLIALMDKFGLYEFDLK